jgi:hypothetical protein
MSIFKIFNREQLKCQNINYRKGILLVLSAVNAKGTSGLRKLRLPRLHNVFMTIVKVKILKKCNELFWVRGG